MIVINNVWKPLLENLIKKKKAVKMRKKTLW